jgi:hypothetical protein
METIGDLFSHLRPRRRSEEEARQAEADRKAAVIEKIARAIVARRLEAPAALFLELNRPIGFIYSQMTYFARPFLSMVLRPEDVTAAAEVLDDAGAIDQLLDRIQELSAEERPRGRS